MLHGAGHASTVFMIASSGYCWCDDRLFPSSLPWILQAALLLRLLLFNLKSIKFLIV